MNIGPEFQAELPDLIKREESEEWPEESQHEELLWKPWAELKENDALQERGKNRKELLTIIDLKHIDCGI